MWTREAIANHLASLQVDGQISTTTLTIDETGNISFGLRAGSTRTTLGLQVLPRFGNSWYTSASGAVDQLTVARYPDGMVHLSGKVSNNTAGFRADGVYAFDFTATSFAQTFIPKVEVHMLADGTDRANNQQPVFVLGTDGTVRCYNLDNTTAAQVDYRINACWNIYTTPGKYEGSGGY